MSDESGVSDVKNRLIHISGFLVGAAKVLMIFAIVIVMLNGLSNFLHAPIGIKDSSPDPGLVGNLARVSVWPLFAAYLGLRLLKWSISEYTLVEVATAIVAIGSLGVLALWVLATSFHIELIPGSARLIRLVLPFPIALMLLSVDLFVTWAFCCEWKLKGVQFRFGTAILCASTLPALWAFGDLCMGERTLFVERAALSALLFVVGIGITPRPEPGIKIGDAASQSNIPEGSSK